MPNLIRRSLGPSPFVQRRGRPSWALGEIDFDFENNRFYSPNDGETTITGASGFALNSATLSSGLVVGSGGPSMTLAPQSLAFPLTVLLVATSGASYTAFPALYTFDNSVSGSQSARCFYNAGTSSLIVRQDDASGTASAGPVGIDDIPADAEFTAAFVHSDGFMAGALNGVSGSATPSAGLLALNRLEIGHSNGNNQWPDTIKRLTIYAGVRTAAEIEALTA